MRARSRAAPAGSSLLSIALLVLAACGQTDAVDSSSNPGAAGDDPLEARGDDAPPQPSLKDLGPTGRRVKVIVLPGDAAVEVDGVAARRRDGVIELMGKVGEVRRLRVFKGAESAEQSVTIQEAGASPPLLDLSALNAPSTRPGESGKAAGSAPIKDGLDVDKFE